MPHRQSLCGSFIVKGNGERKRERKVQRGRRHKDQPASLEKQWERVGMGGAFLLMGPLHVSSDLAIGP